MAELNVDKSLVEESALVQSDEVVAMQNGCVCCTLKNDLTEQIYALSKSGRFDYMVIEASGISEPSQIASAFNEDHSHEADHGHHADHDHSAPDLGAHAVLDTCCTVVSAAEFFENFESVTPGSNKESWPRLMVEQIEYANVIIVNKADLVSKAQLAQIEKHVCVLNPSANVITAQNSSINVSEVVNTGLYDASSFKSIVDMVEELELGDTTTSDCCAESIARGEKACCSKKSRTIKTFLSEVILGSATLPKTRHETRFGITSFCYKARRPFNPGRLMKFINKYFVVVDSKEEEEDGDDGADDPHLEEGIKGQQAEAKSKQALRAKDLGVVLRSKGFIWTAHSHDLMGTLGSAGNTLTITSDGIWHCLDARVYDDDCDREVQRKLKKDFKAPWGDRRQEIVFIGLEMKHKAIQEVRGREE